MHFFQLCGDVLKCLFMDWFSEAMASQFSTANSDKIYRDYISGLFNDCDYECPYKTFATRSWVYSYGKWVLSRKRTLNCLFYNQSIADGISANMISKNYKYTSLRDPVLGSIKCIVCLTVETGCHLVDLLYQAASLKHLTILNNETMIQSTHTLQLLRPVFAQLKSLKFVVDKPVIEFGSFCFNSFVLSINVVPTLIAVCVEINLPAITLHLGEPVRFQQNRAKEAEKTLIELGRKVCRSSNEDGSVTLVSNL